MSDSHVYMCVSRNNHIRVLWTGSKGSVPWAVWGGGILGNHSDWCNNNYCPDMNQPKAKSMGIPMSFQSDSGDSDKEHLSNSTICNVRKCYWQSPLCGQIDPCQNLDPLGFHFDIYIIPWYSIIENISYTMFSLCCWF